MNQNTKQNKIERNHKIGFFYFILFFYNRENWSGGNGGQSSLFFNSIQKLNLTKDDQSDKPKP